MGQPGEPSVEEILASIKKVIARDSRAEAASEARLRAAPAESPMADDEDEILDLADIDGLLEAGTDSDESPLLATERAESMRESLTALRVLAAPGAAPQIVRSGETSLEGLTRELLRPALADWLDKNLPPMVERLVAAEIARIVGKKG